MLRYLDMSDAKVLEAPTPGTTDDTRAIIRSIVGTGIGLATLLLMLAGLLIQQNANVNARIDDLQEDIRELRALIIDAIKGADPAD